MDTEQSSRDDIKVKKFREILIWPLQIELYQQSDQSQDDLNKWDYKDYVDNIKNSCCWQEIKLVDRGISRSKVTPYAEFVYFHPFVQRFLYNTDRENHNKKIIHIFQRNDIKEARVKLNPVNLDINFNVNRVNLYLFEMGVALLVVEISYDADDHANSLYLKQVQNILDSFRRAYPPYWEDGYAGHCPDEVTWILDSGIQVNANYQEKDRLINFVMDELAPPVAGHWQYLLKPMVPFRSTNSEARYCYRQVGDERIPFMAYIAIDDPHLITKGDWVRLAFADGSGESNAFPYSPDFLSEFKQHYCYDRYWYSSCNNQDHHKYNWMNTRYLCAGYSFLMVGQDEPKFFINDTTGGLAHFRHHYFQMGLIVHFHKAALLVLSDRLSKAVDSFSESTDIKDLKDFNDQVERILRDFLHFSQRYWFQEISNQTQAIELFEWWGQHLKTRELFEFVRREAHDINGYLDMTEQQKTSNTTLRLTVVASFGFIFALIDLLQKSG